MEDVICETRNSEYRVENLARDILDDFEGVWPFMFDVAS